MDAFYRAVKWASVLDLLCSRVNEKLGNWEARDVCSGAIYSIPQYVYRKTSNKRPRRLIETRRLLEHWPLADCLY